MHPYPPHLPGFDYIGLHRYFLTYCTKDRRPLFTDPRHVALVEEHFLRTAHESAFADFVHCFMPDHVHAVVGGQTDAADLRRFVKGMKQSTGFYFKKECGCRLWQRYGFERILRDDESTIDVMRYVLANPVRAGLVARVHDYPFIGSSGYTREQLLDFCL
jgi:REP element-mobilizing transposase RayT